MDDHEERLSRAMDRYDETVNMLITPHRTGNMSMNAYVEDAEAFMEEIERLRARIDELYDLVRKLECSNEDRNAELKALRAIAAAVAAIKEGGDGWSDNRPYDAQVSLLTIARARALLAKEL
jgi:hypothetical protein